MPRRTLMVTNTSGTREEWHRPAPLDFMCSVSALSSSPAICTSATMHSVQAVLSLPAETLPGYSCPRVRRRVHSTSVNRPSASFRLLPPTPPAVESIDAERDPAPPPPPPCPPSVPPVPLPSASSRRRVTVELFIKTKRSHKVDPISALSRSFLPGNTQLMTSVKDMHVM